MWIKMAISPSPRYRCADVIQAGSNGEQFSHSGVVRETHPGTLHAELASHSFVRPKENDRNIAGGLAANPWKRCVVLATVIHELVDGSPAWFILRAGVYCTCS
jgi:hypothetical protein